MSLGSLFSYKNSSGRVTPKSFARWRKSSGVMVCLLFGCMDNIFTRISADFSTVCIRPKVRSKSCLRQRFHDVPRWPIVFLHQFGGSYCDLSAARYHPGHYAHTIREYYGAPGCHLHSSLVNTLSSRGSTKVSAMILVVCA